jgi:hypothetical protein
VDQVTASAARGAEASGQPMHVTHHMSFDDFESKNQLGKFPVAPPDQGAMAGSTTNFGAWRLVNHKQ